MNEYNQLFQIVLAKSDSKKWEQAVDEWTVIDCVEDDKCSGSCICGKENLKYLYTIRNKYNGNELFPIGSSCIRKFNNESMDYLTKLYEQEFRLYHAVEHNEYISLKNGLFTRLLLEDLYNECAFDTEYNNYNGKEDYQFMLKMFNKRDEPTYWQDKKIKAIILNSIKPFIQKKLKEKIK